MAIKALKYNVECNDFLLMRMAFNDCIRYSQAKIIFIDYDTEPIYAKIELIIKNPSMRKEALNLMINRWESCGFKLTKVSV